MAQVIIGIHGLGNKPSKKTLEKWWIDSINEGFHSIGKTFRNFKFELVYWADLVYEKPLNEILTDKDDPYYLEEKYVPASPLYLGARTFRKKLLDFLQLRMDRIFLNEDFSMNYSNIANGIIHRYFKDLEAYYDSSASDSEKKSLKEIVRERLANILKKYENSKIILIGHSMGSIIAYDVLTHNVPEIPVYAFITMGSPLGLPVVKSKIAAENNFKELGKKCLCTPQGVKNWYNFSDLDDNVSINYCLGDDYSENKNGIKVKDFTINNDYQINRKRNPHHIIGYLRTSEFANTLADILSVDERSYLQKIKDYFRDIFRKR